MIKNYLFDIDGTLTDTKEAFFRSLHITLDHFGIQRETDPSLFGMSVDKAIEKLNISNHENLPELADFWEKSFETESARCGFYPGIKEMCEALNKKGFNIYLVTSRNHKTSDSILKTELGPYIRGIVAAEDTKRNKPYPDPVLLALEILNSSPDEAIYIGDTYHDYQAGTSAGVRFGFPGWNKIAERFDCYDVFENPSEIASLSEKER